MIDASLTVVGSGIKFMSQLTTEAKVHIEQSSIVLYLVNEPAMKQWIQKVNPCAESLDDYYTKYKLRSDCYQAITLYILETLRKKQHVCVVLYGHPTVFAKPALDAVIQAKQEGYFARILPGISTEDCLFADLLIDPGSKGCLSFEATDLLIHKRKLDISCHVILWQVSVVGALVHARLHDNTNGIKILLEYLNQFYKLDHQVTLYSAAQYPGFESLIQKVMLKQLPEIQISRTSTLYIPPAQEVLSDREMLNLLGINVER